MQLTLMIEGQEGVGWGQWTALAAACERNGFDGLFRSDHYASFAEPGERETLDAWATLAALAAVTSRIRLGALVSPATFRHPSVLAKMVATVDHVSEGRIELGLGAGWHEGEHLAFGFPFPPVADRIAMLEEQVEIMHLLWDRTRPEVTFAGEYYRLQGATALPRPYQDPHPPLILGGAARARSAALAARRADEYNLVAVDVATARERGSRIAAACEAVGRDPAQVRLSLMTTVVVGETGAEVNERAAELMRWQGESGDPGAYVESLRSDRLVGTPEQILERLAAYADVGIRRTHLQHLLHHDLEQVDLLGEAVVAEASRL